MKLGLAAFDKGPNDMFAGSVKAAAETNGHTVVLAPATGNWDAQLFEELGSCDLVATGFASFRSHQEGALAGYLMGMGTRHVLVEDVPGALTERVKDRLPALMTWADGLVVALPGHVDMAQRLGFTGRVTSITPPSWGASYEALTRTGDLREGLHVMNAGNEEPLGADEPLIVVCGTKELSLEQEMMRHAVAAGQSIFGSGKFVVGAHLHPAILKAERVDSILHVRGYAEIFGTERRLVTEGTKLGDVLRAASAIVFSGGPMESISGAFARLPLMYYSGNYPGGTVNARNVSQGMSDGKWFVVENGGALSTDGANFREVLEALLSHEGRAGLMGSQEQSFPVPASWDTAPQLIGFLEEICRK